MGDYGQTTSGSPATSSQRQQHIQQQQQQQQQNYARPSTSQENPLDDYIDPETFEQQRKMAQYQQQQQQQQQQHFHQQRQHQHNSQYHHQGMVKMESNHHVPPQQSHYQQPQFQQPQQRHGGSFHSENVKHEQFSQYAPNTPSSSRHHQQHQLQDSPFNGIPQNVKYDRAREAQHFQQNPNFHHHQEVNNFQQPGPSDSPMEMANPMFTPPYQGPPSHGFHHKSSKHDDSTPMTSPRNTIKNSPRAASFKPIELTIVLDPEYPGDEPEAGITYPDPVLFDIKNTNITENELEELRTSNPPRSQDDPPDANSTPNKIVEYLMSFRILKESELVQLNSYRTRRNQLSLNLVKQNAEREFDQKACESLVKKLKDKKTDLQNLIDVVVSKGEKYNHCITIARTLDGRLQVHGKKGFPHVVYGKLWRFADMSKNETRNIDSCKHPFESKTEQVKTPTAEGAEVCVNPYHYEIVAGAMIVGHRDAEGPSHTQKMHQEVPIVKTAPIAHIAQAPVMLHSPEPPPSIDQTFSPTHQPNIVQQQQPQPPPPPPPQVQPQPQSQPPLPHPYSPHHQQHQHQVPHQPEVQNHQQQQMMHQQQQQQQPRQYQYPQYPPSGPPELQQHRPQHAHQHQQHQQPNQPPRYPPNDPQMVARFRAEQNDSEIYPYAYYPPIRGPLFPQQQPQQPPAPPRITDPRQMRDHVPLNHFRHLCRETFGSQFFTRHSVVELPEAPYPNGTYSVRASEDSMSNDQLLQYNPVLGVSHLRRRVTSTDYFDQTNMPKTGAYSDMIESITSMTLEKIIVNRIEPPTKEEQEKWATIVYYEYSNKISEREMEVNEIAVDGGFTACDNRFCLGLEPNPTRTRESFKIRRLMIDGIRLSLKENGDVWVQNYIKFPIFVTSGYLDEQSGAAITEKVHKLYGGCKLKVFGLSTCKELIRDQLYSSQMASMYLRGIETPMDNIYGKNNEDAVKTEAAKNTDNLQRYCIVRISFGKGFGKTFNAKEIKHTPVWIEIKVNSAFDWMDRVVCDLAHRCEPLKLEDFARLGINVADDD